MRMSYARSFQRNGVLRPSGISDDDAYGTDQPHLWCLGWPLEHLRRGEHASAFDTDGAKTPCRRSFRGSTGLGRLRLADRAF